MPRPDEDPPNQSEHTVENIFYPLTDQRFRDWLCVTPVVNLRMDRRHVHTGELEVAGVVLMDLDRFNRVAKRRWGAAGASLRSSLREMFLRPYKELGAARPLIHVVALQHGRERGRDLEDNFLGNVRRALAFLASTLWTYKGRHPLSNFGELENASRGQRAWFFQDVEKPFLHALFEMAWTRGLMPTRIDVFWIAAERRHRFLRSINSFFQDNTLLTERWKTAVARALQLFGEGYLEHDAQQAVLANMIALDVLLFENGEKQTQQVPLLDGMLRCVRAYTPPGPAWADTEALTRLVCIRNDLVHEGHTLDLTIDDLLLADDIVGNLLLLILRNRSDFRTKIELREFAKEEMARALLQQETPRRFVKRNQPVVHVWKGDQKERIAKSMSGLQDQTKASK